MNLLKELPLNFRYYLLTTKDKKIIIIYYKSPVELESDVDDTILETTYFKTVLSAYKFDDSLTIKRTVNENENTINEFNTEIANYCYKSSEIKEIRFINTQYTHDLIFEEKVFEALNKCSKNLYFELGYSAIRVGSENYEPMDKFEFKSGYLFPSYSSKLIAEEFDITDMNINTYNGSESDTAVINFVVNENLNANRMQIYSTLRTTFIAGNMDANAFNESEISIAYLKIYGQEILEDRIFERIKFDGPKDVFIGHLEIEDNVQYGNIVKANNLTSLSINKITRNVSKIENGTFLVVDKVATVNIYDIKYNLTPNSYLPNNSSLVTFLSDTEKKLSRSINIFNTDLTNLSDIKFNILNLNDIEIDKIYVTTCKFSANLNLMSYTSKTKINSISINDSSFVSNDDIVFNNCNKISFTDCNIETLKNIELSALFIFLSSGIWSFDKLKISNDAITKLSIENIEMHGNKLDLSGNINLDTPFFDIKSAFDVKEIISKGFEPTLNESKFRSKKITIDTIGNINLINSIFILNEMNLDLNINGSICGSCIISKSLSKNEINLTINDLTHKLNINTIDFTFTPNAPILKTRTNSPIKFNIYQHDNDYLYISYDSNYESKQNSTVIIHPDINNPINHNILTNSEKLVNISGEKNNIGAFVYTITKK